MKLINKLKDLIELSAYVDEKIIINKLVDIVYEEHKDDTLNLFLNIQEMDRLRIKAEKQVLYTGLEFAMHNSSSLGRHLLEDKTSRQAKSYASYIFNPDDGNIASLIYICKAYFADGKSDGASNSGAWLFNQLVTILRTHKDRYLKGGDSYDWAKTQGVYEYIELVIEKNNL